MVASLVPGLRGMATRTGRLLMAALLAKPAMYVALRISADQLCPIANQNAFNSQVAGQQLLGVSLAFVAMFMPPVVWAVSPLFGEYVVAAGLARGPFEGTGKAREALYQMKILDQILPWVNKKKPKPGPKSKG
jgi:hypothetical protein